MIRSLGPVAPLQGPELEWTPAGDPKSVEFDDGYFSPAGGDEESWYVFIEGSDLVSACADENTDVLRIAELGFGTGLNFLITWACFLKHAPPSKRLLYWSVDKHPLRQVDLERALKRWPRLRPLSDALIRSYPIAYPGLHRRLFDHGRICLDIAWADARDALEELEYAAPESIDIWYLDGFTPARNGDMWQPDLYQRIARTSKLGGRLATYTTAGHVRRGLMETGYSVSKRPGFGTKRECLSAVLDEEQTEPTLNSTAWEQTGHDAVYGTSPQPPNKRKTALVIGAGLAGAHVAHALAIKGVHVEVLDAGAAAGRASGNEQGILFTRVYPERGLVADFSALAFAFSSAFYAEMFANGHLQTEVDGDLNGCFQALSPDKYAKLSGLSPPFTALAECIDANEASRRLGANVPNDGVWQTQSGWLSPPSIVRALLDHPNITLREESGALRLEQSFEDSWSAITEAGELLATAPVAVIAGGTESRQFSQTTHLPTKAVRGQTTNLPSSIALELKGSYCHNGYIAASSAIDQCVGATFAPGDSSRELRSADHRVNLEHLASALPDYAEALARLDVAALSGRAELRCASPDYLPMAGPAPIEKNFVEHYSELGKDARRVIEEPGPHFKGLYVSTAFGSRGLSYACLSAELIASQICGDAPPISRELVRALSPARFLIRSIIRGKQK